MTFAAAKDGSEPTLTRVELTRTTRKGTAPIEMWLDIKYLLDAIKVVDSDQVELRLASAPLPFILKAGNGTLERQLTVMMPMHHTRGKAAVA